MKKILLIFTACVLNTFQSNAQSITRLLVVSKDDDLLRVLDTNSYATVKSKTMSFTNSSLFFDGSTGLSKNTVTGSFYIVVKESGDRRLGVLNPLTGDVTDKGVLGDNFAAITHNQNNTLLGVTGDGASVPETAFRIDTISATNGAINFMGAGADGEVICFNPPSKKVYHWSGNGTVVYQKYDTNFVTPVNLPVGGYTGEIFAAVYKTSGKFITANINDEFRLTDTLGNFGPALSTFTQTIKGMAYITCPRIITGALSFCQGSSTTLTMSGQGESYQWYKNNVAISGATSKTLAATQVGYYKCMINDACGMDSLAAGVTLQMLNSPIVTITGSSVVCAGQSATLTGSSGGTSQWYLNGAPISGATSNTYSASQPGIYNMIKTNTNGCADSAAIGKVLIISQPTLSVVASTPAICQGSTVTFTASGALSYTWSSGTGSVISVTAVPNTTYTVSGTNSNACVGTTSVSLTVNPLPPVNASSNMPTICEGESATLTASGASSYTWTGNAPGASLSVNPAQTTTYTLMGTGTNGCSASFQITQNVSACTGITTFKNNTGVQIYPNPSNGEFTIRSEKPLFLSLVNETGQLIRTISLTKDNAYQVSVKDLAKGLYFVVGQNETQQLRQKLLISE